LKRADDASLPRVRVEVYRTAILVQWGLALAALGLWVWTRRPFGELGLVPRLTGGFIGTALGVALVAFYIVRQRRGVLRNPSGLDEVRQRLAHLERMLPHSRAEFVAFARLALTAGICEELLYRGYLTWYLSHALPWGFAVAASALAFGVGHAYQGLRGVAQTTLVGAFLGVVYYLSGSLFVAMAIHALMDLHSGHLAWRAYEAERTHAASEVVEPDRDRDAETEGVSRETMPDAP
jgi:membrane protease YdiL (CAAX protease family)